MSDEPYQSVDECLACLSLEELAEVAVCFMHKTPGVLVIPEQQPANRPLVVVVSQEGADEVDRYWRSVFGDVDSGQASQMATAWRQGQELTKLTAHAKVHGDWLEDHEKA